MLAMALLIGLVSGVVLVAAAGARRTDTAYPRFLSRSHAADLLVTPAQSGFHGYFRAVASLPQVAAADAVAFLQMSLPGPGASPYSGLVAEASPTGGEGTAINRVKVLARRSFDPADPHAVMISQVLASRAHLQPGGTLHLIGYPQRHGGPSMGRAVRLAFRVSAIVVTDDEIVPATHELAEPRVLLSPAFFRHAWPSPSTRPMAAVTSSSGLAPPRRVHQPGHRPGRAVPGGAVQVVHLRPSTQPPSGHSAGSGGPGHLRRATGLIALAVVGRLLNRQLVLDAAESRSCGPGMSRSRLAVLSLAREALVPVAGAAAPASSWPGRVPSDAIGAARFASPAPKST